ncbi:MAG: hypothetical protein FJX74_25125 [Armatimonadetes bacterium]|nr:hypothetical protein [Armatimonadota bacterium]
MLTRLHAKGFKSLIDLEVEFRPLTVLFGPNASGKSNILEAVQALAIVGSALSASERLGSSLRGYPLELFAFPPDGLPGLLRLPAAQLSLEADLLASGHQLRYRADIELHPPTGRLVATGSLAELGPHGAPVLSVPGDIRPGGRVLVHTGAHYAVPAPADDRGSKLAGTCLRELGNWRTYYLDPRVAMRSAQPPSAVSDIGPSGESIAPYLHRLKAEHPKLFAAVRRTLSSLVPSVEDLDVDLDERRGELSVQIRQDGCDFSSRVISEGTLRVLALCAIAVNPWAKGLVAFEEPENGVHPRRLELIAQLFVSLATHGGRQVIATTHSARFCDAVLRLTDRDGDTAALVNVHRGAGGTLAKRVELPDSLFQDQELLQGLSSPTEDGLFEGLLMRGLLDE